MDGGFPAGHFGMALPRAEREKVMELGEMWVGDGYTVHNYNAGGQDGVLWISKDGLKQFRPPAWKKKFQEYQANFEWRLTNTGLFLGDGHMTLIQP
jgi:filamentous hemagglutinin